MVVKLVRPICELKVGDVITATLFWDTYKGLLRCVMGAPPPPPPFWNVDAIFLGRGLVVMEPDVPDVG